VSVLYVLLPLVLLMVAVAVAAFLWAARRGQFDDLDTPALRALHDDEAAPPRPAPGAAASASTAGRSPGRSGDSASTRDPA
jgi:cbb3-type cytochrome oxidase maturation protein